MTDDKLFHNYITVNIDSLIIIHSYLNNFFVFLSFNENINLAFSNNYMRNICTGIFMKNHVVINKKALGK